MRFLWPSAFILLTLIPLLILLFVWRQRRRRRFAVRYSSLSLVRAALPEQSRLRRYLPMALFFLALASLVSGLSRPVMAMQVPAGRATVMLTLDVSGSMRQNDIAPSRLGAAKQAALRFIENQKNTTQIGIVAFAGIAQLVQPPGSDTDELKKAVRNLTTGRNTAIGDGIVTALDTITDLDANGTAAAPPAAGQYRPDIIVLLTDGVATRGVDPLEAAELARDSGVRVYTIAFGTPVPEGMEQDDGSRSSYRRRWGIDEQSLKAIAAMTGGEYYTAGSAGELQAVFDSLPTVFATREETLEISVAFAALAALLVTGAVLLAQLWHPLP
jgi:Ca-activated chloride channel homolog